MALLASSPAEQPPTGLMLPMISCLAPDCGRRLAGDGDVSGAADGLALLASSPAEPPPTGLMSPRILRLTPDCGRQLCWRWLCDRRSRCIGLAGVIAGRAASHRIDVAHDLVPGTGLWEAACRRWRCVRRSRWVGLAGLIAGRAASHRIDVAQNLAPDTGLWEAALLANSAVQGATDLPVLLASSLDRRLEPGDRHLERA